MFLALPHRCMARPPRGTALVMMVVLSVVITAIVMVIAWTTTTMVQSTSLYMKQARANAVAEGALQRAYWRYKHDHTFRADPYGSPPSSAITGSEAVDGSIYSYTITVVGQANAPVLVTATATSGPVQASVHVTLTAAGAPPSAIATSGQLSSTSLLDLTGDLISLGKISTSGTFNVNGNVDTGSTFGGGTVTGTTKTNDQTLSSSSVPNVAAIYNRLQPAAYTIAAGNLSVLDFSSSPVLFANGDVNLKDGLVVIGTGTLVVNGSVSTVNSIGALGDPKTFNIVSTGDFTGNKVYLTGSIYSAGSIQLNNVTALTGCLVANGDVTMNYRHTITYATPPGYDLRGTGVSATNYGGANP